MRARPGRSGVDRAVRTVGAALLPSCLVGGPMAVAMAQQPLRIDGTVMWVSGPTAHVAVGPSIGDLVSVRRTVPDTRAGPTTKRRRRAPSSRQRSIGGSSPSRRSPSYSSSVRLHQRRCLDPEFTDLAQATRRRTTRTDAHRLAAHSLARAYRPVASGGRSVMSPSPRGRKGGSPSRTTTLDVLALLPAGRSSIFLALVCAFDR